MVQINKEVVAEILQKTPTAESFAAYAANRKREVRNGVSPLLAIRAQMESEGYIAVPEDLLLMFKELDRAGVGKLDRGRFKWHVPIKEVSEVLTGPKRTEAPKAAPAASDPNPSKVLFVSFGPSKDIKISLPGDLTNNEVRYLCSKILQECG